jgi:hypothetical protein
MGPRLYIKAYKTIQLQPCPATKPLTKDALRDGYIPSAHTDLDIAVLADVHTTFRQRSMANAESLVNQPRLVKMGNVVRVE